MIALGCERTVPFSDVQVGHALPAFRLEALDGARVSGDSLRGKAVVLNFWATWCEPCRREMPSLQRLADAFDGSQLAVIGIATDRDVNLVREFALRHGLRFPILLDAQQSTASVFGVRGYPLTYLVRRDGTVALVAAGPREWDEEVNVAEVERLLGPLRRAGR